MGEEKETPTPSIRADVMAAIGGYRDWSKECSLAQDKTTSDGLSEATRYMNQSDAAEELASVINTVLKRRGL